MATRLVPLLLLITASITGGCHLGETSTLNSPTPNRVLASLSQEDIRALEAAGHEQVNDYRQSQGLPPLELDSYISEVARKHSLDMASGDVPFSHDGVEERYEAIGQQMTYRQIAENVAYNSGHPDPVQQAVQGWIESPGHEQNMTGDYEMTGFGIAVNAEGEYYFTQLFVRPR